MFIRLLALLLTTSYLLLTNPVYAAGNVGIGDSFGPPPAGLQEFENIVGNVISVIVGLGFIAMLVMVIWAGLKYLTSGGEPKAIQAAHQTLTWALLGILFFALAWLILQLVAAFTGINDLTVFNIKILCNIGGQEFCKP